MASTNDGNVEISDFMESAFCQITADTGSVQANRIKTESLTIITNSGEIICSGHIQGTVKISSATGNVVADQRFIGPSLDISTDSGDVSTPQILKTNALNLNGQGYVIYHFNPGIT